MRNPLFRRDAKRESANAHGLKAEAKAAKLLGARLTPASGAAGMKGDMDLPDFRVESKATNKNSLSVKLEWLDKITGEARHCGKTPAVVITFCTDSGEPRANGRWVMVPDHVFSEIAK